jgi:hypothetical protein
MKAGWIVALVYLLCVMAPTLSYALPGEFAVPCMSMGGLMSDSMQMHDHSPAHAMAMSDDHERSSMSAAMDGEEAPSNKGPHTTSGQCCALMCVSAMPAPLFDFAMPPVPTVVRIATGYRAAADNAPAVQYRPPIA